MSVHAKIIGNQKLQQPTQDLITKQLLQYVFQHFTAWTLKALKKICLWTIPLLPSPSSGLFQTGQPRTEAGTEGSLTCCRKANTFVEC